MPLKQYIEKFIQTTYQHNILKHNLETTFKHRYIETTLEHDITHDIQNNT